MASTRTPDPDSGWLSDEELAQVRRRLPILYVEAVPVRLDGMGIVTEVGALLRVNPAGSITRTLVSGRVMYGETLRDDDRQHAVSLAFVVPVTGTCDPRQDALELTWLTPEEAASDRVSNEMEGGRGALLRTALASVGVLP